MSLMRAGQGFDLVLGGRLILRHRPEAPCLFVGAGQARMDMHRGNFDIEDRLLERTALCHAEITSDAGAEVVRFAASSAAAPRLILRLELGNAAEILRFDCADPAINRVWLRIVAEPGENVWGGGEQMLYFDLRGRRFPLWTSEPGVGRDKTSPITMQAHREGKAGGDY